VNITLVEATAAAKTARARGAMRNSRHLRGRPSLRGRTHAFRARAPRAVAAVLAIGILAGGCGSVTRRAAAPAPRPVSLPLATSLAAGQVTWAVVPMGAAAGPNLFWHLFVLSARGNRWTLATPPDVATNGAIAMGVQDGGSLVAGIHPSLLLDFSPITSTPNGGRTWSTGAPDPGLANVPDALGAAPHGGQLIALDRNGSADLAGAGHAGWTTLTSTRALAATPAGRACGVAGLTAAAFSTSGSPMLAGSCTRPGVAGIFADQGGTWHASGPPLPASLRQQKVQVLRLTQAGSRLTALLQAGAGRAARLVTAWTTGSSWTLSAPLRLTGRSVLSSSFGSGGAAAVELTGQRGEFVAGPGSSWQPLPRLPQGRTVTLALPAGGGVDALATDGSLLTAWRLSPAQHSGTGGGTWIKAQATKVPIQYGSSS
jgi:hypothetical protein